MKNIFKYTIQSLTLLFLLAGITFISSCNEDDPLNTDEVILLSFGPSGVLHGDEVVFIGQNLDKVSSVVFKPDVTVEKSEFIEVSPGSFKVVVPQGAEAGRVILNTPQGQIESKALLNFKVDVVISSVTAEAKPGTNITITGTKINWIERVTFTSDVVVEKDDFVSQSQTELVVAVPLEAQSGFLIFATGGTEPLTFASEEELTVTVPTVSAMNPGSIRHTANLTIAGTDLDLITDVIFNGGDGDTIQAVDFVSHSETEIVVTVPATAETGTLILRQASPVEVVTNTLTIILPVGTSVTPTPAVPGEDEITIIGTDLDLVEAIILSGAGSITNFISQSPTQIVLAVPANATLGPINYVTVHGYPGGLGVVFMVPAEGPPPLIVALYEDAITNIVGEGGGWNSTSDFANTENPREGSSSIKVNYTGSWGGGAQFGTWGKDPVSVAGTEVFTFSIFGVGDIGGESIQVVMKDNVGGEFSYLVQFEADTWTDVEIPLADLGGLTTFTEVFFQNTDQWTGTVYIDRVGFAMASGPPPLSVVLYDDAIADIGGEGGGWNSTSDFANTENTREGSNAIKVVYTDSWGGGAQIGTWGKDPISVAGTSVFAFSIFGVGDIGGESIQVLVKDGSGDYTYLVEIESGSWKDVEIPLADIGNITQCTEVFFQNTDQWNGTVYIDYVGFR